MFMLILILVLNLGISWWNARVTGLMWAESKYYGGWSRLMAWSGAVMSASGFTWCYLIILMIGGHYIEPIFAGPEHEIILTKEAVTAGLSLGYLIIIPGVLISGLLIWVESLVQAWKQRDFPSVAVAGWNTFAQIHNMYSAMKGIPEAFSKVSEFFLKGDKKGSGLIILLVVLALISGVLTTWSIINKYAGSRKFVPGQATA